MKVVGIIAEYNPFHKGHEYQIRYAREILGMERATLRVFAHNRAALACYRRCGFRETGLEEASFPHGDQMWDCYSMEARL